MLQAADHCLNFTALLLADKLYFHFSNAIREISYDIYNTSLKNSSQHILGKETICAFIILTLRFVLFIFYY